jgi:hypothetical protein
MAEECDLSLFRSSRKATAKKRAYQGDNLNERTLQFTFQLRVPHGQGYEL